LGWKNFEPDIRAARESSLLTARFKFWTSSQASHKSIKEWEVKVGHSDSQYSHGKLSDERCRDAENTYKNREH